MFLKEQTTQWPKEKGQKDKSTKHYLIVSLILMTVILFSTLNLLFQTNFFE